MTSRIAVFMSRTPHAAAKVSSHNFPRAHLPDALLTARWRCVADFFLAGPGGTRIITAQKLTGKGTVNIGACLDITPSRVRITNIDNTLQIKAATAQGGAATIGTTLKNTYAAGGLTMDAVVPSLVSRVGMEVLVIAADSNPQVLPAELKVGENYRKKMTAAVSVMGVNKDQQYKLMGLPRASDGKVRLQFQVPKDPLVREIFVDPEELIRPVNPVTRNPVAHYRNMASTAEGSGSGLQAAEEPVNPAVTMRSVRSLLSELEPNSQITLTSSILDAVPDLASVEEFVVFGGNLDSVDLVAAFLQDSLKQLNKKASPEPPANKKNKKPALQNETVPTLRFVNVRGNTNSTKTRAVAEGMMPIINVEGWDVAHLL